MIKMTILRLTLLAYLCVSAFSQGVTVVPGGFGTAPGGAGGGGCANCVVSTNSYANPAWIVSLAGSKITGAISGASGSLNTTYGSNRILYGDGTGLPVVNQYFKYTPIPGSPVAGDTFARFSITNADSADDPYLSPNSQVEFKNNNGVTALSITPTTQFAYFFNSYNYLTVSPSSSWWNPGVLRVNVYGGHNHLYVPNTSTNNIDGIYGGSAQVENYGSGNINNQVGLSYTGYHGGTGTLNYLAGLYAYATSYGYAVATGVFGAQIISGNDGYSASATTVNTVVSAAANIYGTVGTSYNLRTGKNGSGTVTTSWDLSAETGFNNRIMGKLAIGPSNSTAPTETLDIQDATATTGATRVHVYLGAADGANTTVTTIDGGLSAVHYKGGGSTPSITSGFGSSPSVAGTDSAGRVTVGTGGAASTGTLTFAAAWTTAPSCVANNETTQLAVFATATTTTLVLAASAPFTAADKITYLCIGY